MRDGFRQAMGWLHTWSGLVIGWVLFFMFLTGSLGYVNAEIDRWMKPEVPLRAAMPAVSDMLSMAEKRLRDVAPDAESWTIRFPSRGGSADNWRTDLSIRWQSGEDEHRGPPTRWQPGTGERIDLRTGLAAERGAPVRARKTAGGRTLYRMHYLFHYLPRTTAIWIAGVCTLFMLVACVTGVIVHKKIFADFFTFRPRKGPRSWLDLHNLFAVSALPFHLMITYSGLIFFAYIYASPVVMARYGAGEDEQKVFYDRMRDTFATESMTEGGREAPAGVAADLTPLAPLLQKAERQWGARDLASVRVFHPGDAHARVYVMTASEASVSRQPEGLLFDGVTGEQLRHDAPPRSVPKRAVDVTLALHEGLFAGPVLRWLYFLSSLLGTAMIGAGLLLWAAKRRQQLDKSCGSRHYGLLLVERLNTATLVGLPVAIAAYLWANRLLPVTLETRAAWEVHSLFIVWGLLMLHAALRPRMSAWIEQCCIAAAAYTLLPLLNALTTQHHLGRSVPLGDWAMAGVDLTLLAVGLIFAVIAWRLKRRQHAH